MKLTIADTTYTKLKSLTFAPEADLTGTSMPVNNLTAEIVTDDDLTEMQLAVFKDDLNQVWSSFPVTNVERINADHVRVTASSWILQLEYRTLASKMYTGETAAAVLAEIFYPQTSVYTLDSSLQSVTVTGFCPEQTARDRLTWVLFAIGAYINDVFGSTVNIVPIDSTQTLIPVDDTFWRPTISYGDWVTAVKITSYAFSQASSADEWSNDDSSYKFPLPWVATEQSITLTNANAPQNAPENVIEIDELYLVNSSNANAIISRLAAYYFNRVEVSADVINNRQYMPGDKVAVYTDPATIVAGFIRSTSFKFGVQARSTIRLIAVDDVESGNVDITYIYSSLILDRAHYVFPVGHSYTIQNLYYDKTLDRHRFIYRPTTESVTGTATSAGNSHTVQYAVALDMDLSTGILTVISVDSATQDQNGVVTI